MEKNLNCPKHSWIFAGRKTENNLVVVVRRCANCGRVEDVWEELNASGDFPLTMSQVLEMFHEHLQDCYKAEWAEAIKTPPSLGYPWGGILLKALEKAFANCGIKLKL